MGAAWGGIRNAHWRFQGVLLPGGPGGPGPASSRRMICTMSRSTLWGAPQARPQPHMELGLYGGQTTRSSKYFSIT